MGMLNSVSLITSFFECKFFQYSVYSKLSLNLRLCILVIVLPSFSILNTAPLPMGLSVFVSGLYSYSFVANTYQSFLNLNLLPYPPNTVPFSTTSGFTSIGFSSGSWGGVGTGVGFGYSGFSFGNSVGGGI